MIASTPTPSKPLSRNIRAAVATIRLRFSAACSRLTRIVAPRPHSPLDRIDDTYHEYVEMTNVINKSEPGFIVSASGVGHDRHSLSHRSDRRGGLRHQRIS